MTQGWEPNQSGGPEPGQHGQQPYGQPGAYGQPGPYGQPGAYGQQPSGQPYGGPGQPGPYGSPDPYAAPGPYAPPGYGYGPPPPRPRNGWKIFWIVLGVLLILLAACGTGGYLLYRSQLKVNADKVNEFLGDFRRQDYSAAYNQLCAADRAQGSVSDFSAAARAARNANRGVQSYDIKNVHTQNTNGSVTRTAGGTVTFTDGQTVQKVFSLSKENGKLCIDSGYADLLNGA